MYAVLCVSKITIFKAMCAVWSPTYLTNVHLLGRERRGYPGYSNHTSAASPKPSRKLSQLTGSKVS